MNGTMTKAPTKTELAIPEKLNEIAEQAKNAAIEAASGNLVKTFALAKCVGELRTIVNGLVPAIRPLAGSQLGFRTDRDKGGSCGYADHEIAEALTEAVIHGVRWTGNEMNIISGRMYRTKEHYTRAVKELAGLTDLKLSPGVPRLANGGALVTYRATWKVSGKPDSIDRDFAIRVNSGMGADAIVGKATRKILAAIHATVTGSMQSEFDANTDAELGEGQAPKTTMLADRLANGMGKVPPREVVAEDGEVHEEKVEDNDPERARLLYQIDEQCSDMAMNFGQYLARFWNARNGLLRRPTPVNGSEITPDELRKLVAAADVELASLNGGETPESAMNGGK